MKKAILILMLGVALFTGSSCSFIEEQNRLYQQEVQQRHEEYLCRKFEMDCKRVLQDIPDQTLLGKERQEEVDRLIANTPDFIQKKMPGRMAELRKYSSELRSERKKQLDRLSESFRKLKDAGISTAAEAENHLVSCRDILKQLADYTDFAEAKKLKEDIFNSLSGCFAKYDSLLRFAEKEYRQSPSPANRQILQCAVSNFDPQKRSDAQSDYRSVSSNFASVKKAEEYFSAFLRKPDQRHWNAFKMQVKRINYSDADPARRRYLIYIHEVESCRNILIRLISWEFIGTAFYEWGTCSLDLWIWTSGRPGKRQITVADAPGNWHADLRSSSRGKIKSLNAVAHANGSIIQQVNFIFKNTDGRTVESPVLEYSIYQLAALTYKTGEGELTLESYPDNRPPRGRKAKVVLSLSGMPKLDMDFD